MSRIGKKPIPIPEGVEVKIEGQNVIVKGPKGELQKEVRPEIKVEIKENEILVSPEKETKKTNAFWGLTRTLISNIIKGVTEGYEKKLEIQGVGYRANLEGEDLVLQVGFSHPVKIDKVEGIKFEVEKNIITISGIDKELVGQIAAKIRKVRKPEPYKGKGIRYLGEEVRRKPGKKVVTAEEQ
ncbi:50S ribosomal protein L6 [Patescibacteria group bacterium]|nr:50S ribosomal protein L6 [Patescibacteria group bacterium]